MLVLVKGNRNYWLSDIMHMKVEIFYLFPIILVHMSHSDLDSANLRDHGDWFHKYFWTYTFLRANVKKKKKKEENRSHTTTNWQEIYIFFKKLISTFSSLIVNLLLKIESNTNILLRTLLKTVIFKKDNCEAA